MGSRHRAQNETPTEETLKFVEKEVWNPRRPSPSAHFSDITPRFVRETRLLRNWTVGPSGARPGLNMFSPKEAERCSALRSVSCSGVSHRKRQLRHNCLELQREQNESFEKHAVFNGLLDARGVGPTRSDVARVAS